MPGPKRRPLAERFWEKVDRRGVNECWPWLAAKNFGYGVIGEGGRKTRHLRAHRVSWEIHRGPIPAGLVVCHHCDNPPCVNPAHLFLGTRAGNNLDRVRKGRNPDPARTRHVGESNGRAILTEADVREIRRRRQSVRQQAARFGVSEGTIEAIRSGRLWRHVR